MVPASLEVRPPVHVLCLNTLNEPANVKSNLTPWIVKSTLTVMTILTQPHLPADRQTASAWLAYGRAWATAYRLAARHTTGGPDALSTGEALRAQSDS